MKVHKRVLQELHDFGFALDRIRSTFAALDARDEAAFLAGFAEDGVLDDLSEPGTSTGKPGVKAWFERWTRAAPGARTEIVTLAAIGDDVLVETVVRGRLQAPLGRLTPSDRPFALHRAAIVQMKYEKIEFNVPLDDAMFKMPK